MTAPSNRPVPEGHAAVSPGLSPALVGGGCPPHYARAVHSTPRNFSTANGGRGTTRRAHRTDEPSSLPGPGRHHQVRILSLKGELL